MRVADLVWKFGLRDLWVTGYNFCENVHAGRHFDYFFLTLKGNGKNLVGHEPPKDGE